MLYFNVSSYENIFQHNLVDWCLGGPKANGWTRTGPFLSIPNVKLKSVVKSIINVDDGLAKNLNEVNKWHISFLNNHETISNTLYYSEYLLPRFEHKSAINRAKNFLALFESIKTNGLDGSCVFVADMSGLNYPFNYFRFDGCHRLACAKVLGIQWLPAYIFTLEANQ
jgi:hypothetical protein